MEKENHPIIYGPADEIGEVVAAYSVSPVFIKHQNEAFIFGGRILTPNQVLREMVGRSELGVGFARYWIDVADSQEKTVAEVINYLFTETKY